MKIALAVSPLPGLRVGEVHSLVRDAWLSRRRDDHVCSRPVSDAVAMPYVGSGAEDVLAGDNSETVELGEAGERHFAYRAGTALLLDYTQILYGIPQEGASQSSHIVGRDLAWALREGISEVHIVLPIPGCVSDLGMGILEELGGLDAAREALAPMSIQVLVPGEQRLLGLGGVARSWIAHGLDPEAAQRFENTFSEIVAGIPVRSTGLPLLGTGGGPERSIYAGCGGGIAYVLGLLGAQILPIGDVCIDPMRGEIEDSDLFVYVCGHIGEDLPSGLLAGSRVAASRGVPVVVIYDSGALRKGELARLGLNGAYEIRPERAFATGEATTEELADLPERLHSLVGRVARTWGWN